MSDSPAPAARRLGRLLAVTPAVVVLLSAGPAVAVPPEQWPVSEPVSTLTVLLVLGAIPLALIATISLLVYVPSMARGETYVPGLAWRNENEWFGGPRGGVEAADDAEHRAVESSAGHDGPPDTDPDRGGASARW
ncbi:MAG TPA: hypothetical protein VFD59_04330 [Nocardioidaceae bacterium]|nr:hypothetical protein [Nocardioidaceae bacterium]